MLKVLDVQRDECLIRIPLIQLYTVQSSSAIFRIHDTSVYDTFSYTLTASRSNTFRKNNPLKLNLFEESALSLETWMKPFIPAGGHNQPDKTVGTCWNLSTPFPSLGISSTPPTLSTFNFLFGSSLPAGLSSLPHFLPWSVPLSDDTCFIFRYVFPLSRDSEFEPEWSCSQFLVPFGKRFKSV